MSDAEDSGNKLMLFNRDIGSIPCFRSSLLYGINSGIGTGLLYFMFTSKVRMASHVAVSSFAVITLSYWFYCRYDFAKKKFAISQLQPALQKAAVYEGTSKAQLSDAHESSK
ncbi:hypothetical protein J437_LFUL012961 [Ladona fulva]|uniref:Cytochrome c oxidase assembly protein COX20, mitochondrial n=1 Tax=Ladona fulva TaxID=123851 RepID=A0A8K0KCW1_LADFU|nr:hypothetical protein J437_LFUL012961 [Ladona fulva]